MSSQFELNVITGWHLDHQLECGYLVALWLATHPKGGQVRVWAASVEDAMNQLVRAAPCWSTVGVRIEPMTGDLAALRALRLS